MELLVILLQILVIMLKEPVIVWLQGYQTCQRFFFSYSLGIVKSLSLQEGPPPPPR